MEIIIMSSGNVIKRIREALNLTYADLGKELEVSRTAIYKWENEKAFPRKPQIMKIIEFAKKNKVKVKLNDFYEDK